MSVKNLPLCTVALSILTLVGAARLAQAVEVTTLHDNPVLAPLQMLDGEYDSADKTCLATRTKLMAQRTSLKAKKVYRDVTSSESYKVLADSQKSLKDAKCGEATASQEQSSCQAMTDKVVAQATALGETTQWKALTSSPAWRDMFKAFAAAQKEKCIKPAPQTQGMK